MVVAKCPVIGGSGQQAAGGATSSTSVGNFIAAVAGAAPPPAVGGGNSTLHPHPHPHPHPSPGQQRGYKGAGAGPPVVAGREACGRKVQIREEFGSRWVYGRLTDFDEARAEHRFVAEEGGAENAAWEGGGEEWVCLGKRLFRWAGRAAPDAPPNPTYKDFPGDVAAIGWKVRVYWSEMGRWYTGHVRSFEQRSGRHEVRFCDGDVRFYTVRDEAVLWVERPRKRKGEVEGGPGRKAPRKESDTPTTTTTTTTQQQMETNNNTVTGAARMTLINGQAGATGAAAGKKDARRNGGVGGGGGGGGATPSPPHPNSLAAAGRSGNERTTGAALETPDRKGLVNGIKEEGETELSVWHLRPRRGLPLTGANRNPRFSVLKARVGIFWEGDVRYYRGTISSFNELSGKYTICYDDNTKEELALEEEKFQWYGPRGRSSGYSSAIRDTMLELGAQGLPKQGSVPTPSPPSEEARPIDPQVLISKRVFVYWAANGQYYEGEVLAYCKRRRAHLVWYKDGEVEWLDFAKEHVIWGEHARGCAFPAGLAEDEEPPRGRAAMGWRIAVFWKDDATFYEGKVTGYNCATGRHDVLYDDNETENLSLSSEKVIWRIPPNVGKEGRKASRKKSANNGKSKRSSVSDRTDKEDGAASEQAQSETRGSTPHTSSPCEELKCALNHGKGRGRKNGTKTVQSSSKPRQSRKRRNVTEGESEVIGPSHSGKQEPLTSSLKSSKCDQGCDDVQASEREWRASSLKVAKGTDDIKSVKSMDIGCVRADEGQRGDGTETAEEVATNGNSNEPADQDGCMTRSEVGTGDGQLGQSVARSLHDSDATDREDLKDVEDIPEPGSPMSVDRDPPNAAGEDVKPSALKEMPWDKLPSVDVTRLVRLPPEFGSLEVKLRITAGKPSSICSDQDCDGSPCLQPPKGMDGRQDEPKDAATSTTTYNLLQDRVVAIDQMLSAISRYEQAHQTVGHVASRCDQVAMSEVLAPDTVQEAAVRAGASQMHGTPCLLGTRKSSGLQILNTNEPPAKMLKKTAPCKLGGKKQKSLSSIVSAGSAARINLPTALAVQSVSNTPTLSVPPTVCTAPLISQTSQPVTHISPRATSQFGVSSVPAIVASFCNQPNSNQGYRLVSVDSADSKSRVPEMGGKQGEGAPKPSIPSPGSTLDVKAGSRHLFSKGMQDTDGGGVQMGGNTCSRDLKALKPMKDSKLDMKKTAPGSTT